MTLSRCLHCDRSCIGEFCSEGHRGAYAKLMRKARCGQCGKRFRARACGPTHAVMWAEKQAWKRRKETT